MRKVILLVCATVFFAPAIFAQTLSQVDRDKGIAYLEQTRNAIVVDTNNLTPAQWNFKAAPDKWSVALTLEHIALAEDYLVQMVTQNVMKAPAGPPDRDVAKWTPWFSRWSRIVAPSGRLLPSSSPWTVVAQRSPRSFPCQPSAHHRIHAHHT